MAMSGERVSSRRPSLVRQPLPDAARALSRGPGRDEDRASRGIRSTSCTATILLSVSGHAGRLDDAEAELRQVLELDENFPMAVGTLGSVCAQQGRFAEALTLSERACALTPWIHPVVGQLAALLVRTGASSRAETLLDGLRPGTACGAPAGMAVYHAMCGEFDRAAEWAERAIDARYPLLVALLRPLLGSTPVWPGLARAMNLPEQPHRSGSEMKGQ